MWYGSESGNAVRVEEILNDELLQLNTTNLAAPVFIDDLHIGGDVGCSWLEALVHGSVAVYQPLSDLDALANAVVVPIIGLDDFSI